MCELLRALREFRVEIDYKNGFTYLDRTAPAPDTDMATVGLVLTPASDGGLVISAISSTASPDVKDQVHVGDKLVAVNDAPLQGKPLAAAALALHGKAGEHQRLSLEHDGKTRVVSVTVKELL